MRVPGEYIQGQTLKGCKAEERAFICFTFKDMGPGPPRPVEVPCKDVYVCVCGVLLSN